MKSDIGTIISLAGWTATHPQISDAAFRALAVLLVRQAQLGETDTPTQNDLAVNMRISTRQLRRLLLELETAGALTVEEDGRDRVYRLHYQTPDESVRCAEGGTETEPVTAPAVALPSPPPSQGRESIAQVQKVVQVHGTQYTLTRTKRTRTSKRVPVIAAPPRAPVAAPPIRDRQTPRFDALFGAWPRQQAREAAKRLAHTLALETDDTLWAEIDRAATKWIAFWHDKRQPTENRFIPYLSTWLRGKRWLDRVPEQASPSYSKQTLKIADATELFLAAPEEDDELA